MRPSVAAQKGCNHSRVATKDATVGLGLGQKDLRKITAVVRSALRASSFDESLVDRCAEEAVAQSVLELSEDLDRGKVLENPHAAIVNRARSRAIDMLRREEREAPAIGSADFVAETLDSRGATVAEEGLLNVQRGELRAVVKSLSRDQRKALRMYYFKELSTRDAAAALSWSEATFRRRLKAALEALRDRLGVVEPEQGDRLAVEIGLAASASFMFRGFADQIGLALDHGQRFLARLLAGGGGEAATGTTASGIGRTVGACAAAIGLCAAAVVVGPGLVDHGSKQHPAPPAQIERHSGDEVAAPRDPVVAPPVPAPIGSSSGSSHGRARASTKNQRGGKILGDESGSKKQRTKAANKALGVEGEASSAGEEAPPPEEAAAPEPALGDESGSTTERTKAANGALGGY
jgi:RNA polymerase sigma factor (sigma-70 family)